MSRGFLALLVCAVALGQTSVLEISTETAPAGGFAQIKIYAAKPQAIPKGHIVVTLDAMFFANSPVVGVFGANGDALGLATNNWPKLDVQFLSASAGIGQLAGLPVMVISVPVLATANGTMTVSATSPDSSVTASGSVTVQGTLSVGRIPAGMGVVPAGTLVPITGTGFTPATTVTMDGVVIEQTNYLSPTEMEVTLGGGGGTGRQAGAGNGQRRGVRLFLLSGE
jgi:hypothetical protein